MGPATMRWSALTVSSLLPLASLVPVAAFSGRSVATFVHRHSTGTRKTYNNQLNNIQQRPPPKSTSTTLHGGIGKAETYEWEESQYEIDVTVSVPAGTRARNIRFRASPSSVDLRIKSWNGDVAHDVILLDGTRKMRGRVSVDGTYWAISDGYRTNKKNKDKKEEEDDDDSRLITVTIEKMIVEPQDQFEVVEYDWYGVYPEDDDEVIERKYDEPEELNVREYAASLGVDIDNINMSMVDKTMFSSGLNMTQSTMDELSKAGYIKEVTQQGDGQEFVTDEEGAAVPFASLGENIGADEIMNIDAGRLVSPPPGSGGAGDTATAPPGGGTSRIRSQLPFIDTHSKWHKSVPVEEARDEDGTPLDMGDTGDKGQDTAPEANETSVDEDDTSDHTTESDADAADPIDLLTVKRLKEILREQHLKVSGNKQELRDRLRAHVNSKLKDDNE